MKTPSAREKLESVGLKFACDDRTTPEYLTKFVQSGIAKWAVPIKAGGISERLDELQQRWSNLVGRVFLKKMPARHHDFGLGDFTE